MADLQSNFGFESNSVRKAQQRAQSRNEYARARWMKSGVVPPKKGHVREARAVAARELQKLKGS